MEIRKHKILTELIELQQRLNKQLLVNRRTENEEDMLHQKRMYEYNNTKQGKMIYNNLLLNKKEHFSLEQSKVLKRSYHYKFR
jgi:hypothetical protein